MKKTKTKECNHKYIGSPDMPYKPCYYCGKNLEPQPKCSDPERHWTCDVREHKPQPKEKPITAVKYKKQMWIKEADVDRLLEAQKKIIPCCGHACCCNLPKETL